jgi:hypothetical protein
MGKSLDCHSKEDIRDMVRQFFLSTCHKLQLLTIVHQGFPQVCLVQGAWHPSYRKHSFMSYPMGELCIWLVLHN